MATSDNDLGDDVDVDGSRDPTESNGNGFLLAFNNDD